MTRRSDVLELAVLGVLRESPMHGYELRKRLVALLGLGRTLSYGTLYPSLKDLVRRGLLAEGRDLKLGAFTGRPSKRGRVVYEVTAAGAERFHELLGHAPAAWEDEQFGVHFAFFAQLDQAVRMRILEGRRSRLEERLAALRAAEDRTRARLDAYTRELQQHGVESTEREVRWLEHLIDTERSGGLRRADS